MAKIIETLAGYARECGSTAILFDDAHSKGITYSQLDDITARIYGWLTAKGVGKEDFVLIDLPRGVLPIAAMLGVWRAGAAFVLVEENYAPERTEYIRRDCGCKICITTAEWDGIMQTEPREGYAVTDDHDAAYAIYTSGTSGKPKGVLHEYGSLQMSVDSIKLNGEVPFGNDERLALLVPLNFVASVIILLAALSTKKSRIFVVSYTTLKDPVLLRKFFMEKQISVTFLTPSYVRAFGDNTGPYLKTLFVGSEPANNVFVKNVRLINVYAMSESGFGISLFEIDKPYKICPIGKPSVKTSLIDEEGEHVPDGEIGELCFEVPFVRGYINLPEETEKTFINGICHTGDLAKTDENGDLLLLGRSTDMIKINGNRIEPAEIEAALCDVLHIEWAAAKCIEDGDKAYICAYYTDNIRIDANALREVLLEYLPYYMIPSYYVRVDHIPLRPNGKLDRKSLPLPDLSDAAKAYAPPANETEEKLCAAMAKVLGIEQVGAHDDFYELGGDSLGSIQVIVESGLPGLNASEIFRGRTPKKIAKLYTALHTGSGSESDEAKNARSMKTPHPLTPEQLYMVDYQLYTPDSTMYNLFTMLKFDKNAMSAEKVAAAIQAAIHNHPALLTTLEFNEDGDIVQRYTPGKMKNIVVEQIHDWEFDTVKDTLVQPFRIIGELLHRCRVFETETSGYLFFDVHHTVFDGTSFKVFMENVVRAMTGAALVPDNYYLMLQDREDVINSGFYEASRQYFEEKYGNTEWSTYPVTDRDSRENEMGELVCSLGISSSELMSPEERLRISRNEFFITAAGLAVSIYNGTDNIRLSWIYNGRDDMQMMTTVGLLFRDLPVGFRFSDDLTAAGLFEDVHEQVRGGIEHSCYPYVDMISQVGDVESAYVLYQRDIRDMSEIKSLGIETVDIRQNQAASQTILDMEILDGEGGLELMIDYAASRYNDESIQKFSRLFVNTAKALAKCGGEPDITVGELKKRIADSAENSGNAAFSRKK
ncbi:MAG: AMP-binding protein [Ruminiclostridium sp.]|nr:AMP-binding protein [Ruminiclostridium sp.]